MNINKKAYSTAKQIIFIRILNKKLGINLSIQSVIDKKLLMIEAFEEITRLKSEIAKLNPIDPKSPQYLATEKQKKFIKYLYFKLGLYARCKDDYDRMTLKSAQATIKALNTELKSNSRKWPAKSEKSNHSNKENKTAKTSTINKKKSKNTCKVIVRKKNDQ